MAVSYWKRYEEFLRIDPDDRSGIILRARAVYSFGWAFIAIQFFNLIGMTATYGGWTTDHWIAVAAAFIIGAVIHAIRFYKNFAFYALVFTGISVAAPLGSALPDGTGINSALLPFLIMTPLLNAFICGPRMTIITGFVALALIGFLYYWSVTHVIADHAFYEPRNAQRALQSAFAVIMVSSIGAVFSASTHRAFALLEENVRRARAAERAKSVFLSTMSHELRTPLNGVLGLAQSLQGAELDPEQRRAVKAIESSGQSLLQVVGDILDLSKLTDGELTIDAAPFDPRRMLAAVADAWRDKAYEKGLSLHLDIARDLPNRLVGDEARLRQIIAALVGNAVKFTDHGVVSVIVDAAPDGDARRLRVKVRDTGPGVPEAARTAIFNAFEQADMSDQREFGGAGVGLALSRRLARLMGGDVTLDSAADFGSTFVLSVPIGIAEIEARDLRTTHDYSASRIKPIRVLIVDDNDVNRMVAGRFLQNLGLDYDSAENGAAALTALAARAYDAVLMDKHMPGMSGVDALHAIRALGGGAGETPVIACTADATVGEREALLAEGFADYLAKPLTADALHETLMRAVERAAHHRAA